MSKAFITSVIQQSADMTEAAANRATNDLIDAIVTEMKKTGKFTLPGPLCQTSCRLNRIGTFGGADIRKWLDTDKRTKIG